MKVDPIIIQFLESNRICVLTTIIANGIPHSATMHYATKPGTLTFVFFTKLTSRKLSSIRDKSSKSSIVVGFSERQWKEFQAEGEVELVDRGKSAKYEKIFADKYKGAELDDEHTVIVFRPIWYRYTQFRPKPANIIESGN